jgi:hypothetical protein
VAPVARLNARQVNLMLGGAVAVLVATGLLSWAMGTAWSRPVTAVHGIAGLSLLVLAPLKIRGSVRTGLRRRRQDRWLSVLLGVLVVATVVLGILHASGLWYGVGQWSALWTHVLVAVLSLPFVLWHVTARPSRPRRTDLDRRTLLGGAAVVGVAGVAYAATEGVVRGVGLAGGDRRFTGSHEIGSFDPARMPTVQWFDDSAPETPVEGWELTVAGRAVALDSLRAAARPIEADLDCTGGWWSRQSWDGVALADLLPDLGARSIEVRSATGYSRLLPAGDAADLYLAVGYNGEALRRGHGAPVRLVAPGRRGPWWVKWVTAVEPSDRPWWLQFPFPIT